MQPRPPDRATMRGLLAAAETALAAGPHPERARLDAEALLLRVLERTDPNRNQAWLLAHRDSPVTAPVKSEFEALIGRRAAGEPIQYIAGEAEFFGLPFAVAPGVLIPRPETEHLVEKVLELAGQFAAAALQIADIGAGSGAIAVALAHALPQARVVATDLSPQALAIAQSNAQRNHVAGQIRFLAGDLFAPLAGERFHIVACNPPYIPLASRDSLSVEVREHEPHQALFAGHDGLDLYRRLIPDAVPLLEPGGWLAMEIGYGQQPAIESLLQSAGYIEIHFIADYQGIPRVACGRNRLRKEPLL